ncbi:uncharacterized protein [Enoplosus armatus]|uniref:uncharacterized protein n=1 Tax=Enoplosus armatus TaxID=215367 RepID=UPI00399439DC
MAGRLLFVILMYSFHEIQAQALLPPTLTVNPAVITETDSVTLNCQTPSSVSVSQCYFYILSGGQVRDFSCLKTLTGTELLKMAHQISPAEVQVKCFYHEVYSSPDSGLSSIIIQSLLPPTLTVNPAVITETDSVTLNCQTPSSVSVSQCYFYILSGGQVRDVSCLKTLTGTELLKMAHQSSPAEVQVKCFYTVKLGDLDSSSPHSDTSSITIQTIKDVISTMCISKFSALLPPTLTVNPAVITETDSVTLNCQTPSSVSVSQCYFYTLSGGQVRDVSCLKTLTGTELLKMAHQSSPAEIHVKCFYTVKLGDLDSSSPHSDISSIIIQSRPPKLTVNPQMITETDSVTLNCQTPSSVSVSQCYFYILSGGQVRDVSCLKTLTGTELLKMAHQSSPAEVQVKCFYTVKLGDLDSSSPHSDISSITIQSDDCTNSPSSFIIDIVEKESRTTQTMTTSIMTTSTMTTGSEEVKRPQPQNENFDIYHLYSTISEEPAASALRGMVYSTVQTH